MDKKTFINENGEEKFLTDETYYRGIMRIECRDFSIDKDLKLEFLDTILNETSKKQSKMMLLKLDYFESKIGKKSYDFSFDDVENFVSTGMCYSTSDSLTTGISRISQYIDHCIKKNFGSANNFKLLKFSNSNLLNFAAIRNRYIDEKTMLECADKLHNVSDKLIIELAFLGLYFEEMLTLKKNDVKFSKSEIHLTAKDGFKRIIKNVPKRIMSLLSDNETTEIYLSNNNELVENHVGKKIKPRNCQVAQTSYVFVRCTKKDIPDEPMTNTFFQKRMSLIHKVTGNHDVTITTLRISGILNAIQNYKEECRKKKLELKDFEIIYDQFFYDRPVREQKIYWFMDDIKRTMNEIEKARNGS